jgi:proteasome assembly chaperone (PAC2) family protein
MYSSERGIGGVFETPHRRKHLAAKSLQENLKNEKFVELFKEKLIELKLVTPEHIFELMNRSEKGKHRKRVQSEKTNVD